MPTWGGEITEGKSVRRLLNKLPFVAAVQTTEDRKPVYLVLSQQPFTAEAFSDFMGRSLALPLTAVSDGLGCFAVAGDRAVFLGRRMFTPRRIGFHVRKLIQLALKRSDLLCKSGSLVVRHGCAHCSSPPARPPFAFTPSPA